MEQLVRIGKKGRITGLDRQNDRPGPLFNL
jgi:hypothetical protein